MRANFGKVEQTIDTVYFNAPPELSDNNNSTNTGFYFD
jgi:hypothetical protein